MPKPATMIRPGLWVRSLHGESDLDHQNNERVALPGSRGFVAGKNHDDASGTANWDVRFANGCWVVLTETELQDVASYELKEPSTALQILLSVAWCDGPAQLSLSDEPLCIDLAELLGSAERLAQILDKANELVEELQATPQARLTACEALKGLLSSDDILPWARS